MKHLKIFEEFTDSDNKYPSSITVKATAEFEKKLKDIKNAEGKPSFLALRGEFTLQRNGDRFNLVKVATTPFEVTRNELDGKSFLGKQDDYWLSYDPKNSEIYVHNSRRFGTEFKFDDNEITNIDRRYSTEDYRDVGLIWIGGYYCKFENGFKVGEVDNRGYFEIVKVN